MSFDTENGEKPMTDLLLFLSTISNVWLICVIFYEKRHWQSGYLLLLHLSGKMSCLEYTMKIFFKMKTFFGTARMNMLFSLTLPAGKARL